MRVPKYRSFLGKTQKDFAELLNISVQAYWNKENGRTPFNDVEKKIIKDLIQTEFPDITYEELFFN